MKILAVDYGASRTGLATCDASEFLTTAITPQITLKARPKVAARVCEIAAEIHAELIVVGLPLNMDGTEGERAEKSRKLAKTLERPARPDVGRAAVHLRSRRYPLRDRHLRRPAERDPRLRQRHRHPRRLPRLAQRAPRRDLSSKKGPLRVLFCYSVTVKLLPCPGAESTAMEPPCSSSTFFTIESPRPLPWVVWLVSP